MAHTTRSFFTLKILWKTSPGWLQLVFHFGTENRADQLKKPPPIYMNLIFSLIFFIREESFIILESGDPPEVSPRIKKSAQRKTCSPKKKDLNNAKLALQKKEIWTTQNLLFQVASELDRLHVAGSDLGPALLVRPHQLHPCLDHAAQF